MKNPILKSICLTLLWCGFSLQTTAQGIVVKKTDGTKVYYKSSQVVSIGIYGPGEDPEPDPGTDPDPNNHEWVDLGLPSGTLWATCNVGANSPEEYGDYFAWGETKSKNTYDWSTYFDTDDGGKTFKKYYKNGGLTELQPADDAATANWGSGWKMPSLAQIKELCNSSYTTSEWTQMNGVNGRKVTSKSNGNSIFLPAAGLRSGGELNNAVSYYWSSSLGPNYDDNACYLVFNSGYWDWDYYDRNYGQSVRAVRVQN